MTDPRKLLRDLVAANDGVEWSDIETMQVRQVALQYRQLTPAKLAHEVKRAFGLELPADSLPRMTMGAIAEAIERHQRKDQARAGACARPGCAAPVHTVISGEGLCERHAAELGRMSPELRAAEAAKVAAPDRKGAA